MSENVDLVRSIYAAWERGDFTSAEWAHPEIEYVWADGPAPGTWTGLTRMAEAARGISTGLAGMAERARANLNPWASVSIKATDYREIDAMRVLVLNRFTARGKRSGLEMGQLETNGAHLFHLDNGQVTRLVLYWDRANALADLGLKE